MNILFTAALVAIFIKCITASGGPISQFHEAVDGNDMATAVKLYRKYSRGSSWSLIHVVDTKDQEFIFEFAKQAEIEKRTLLVTLHRKKSPKMIEEAFKVFTFDQNDLRWAASQPTLICSPNDLFNLLGKIEKQEDQKYAIELGVRNLFQFESTKCLDPLLDALDGNESFKHLKDVAIKRAFERGSVLDNQPIVERFYDHPAVTHEDYAEGLIDSGFRCTQEPIFVFLLEKADQDDLIAVKKNDQYKHRSKAFKKAIEDALLIAKPGGTRFTHRDPQRAKLMMEAFDETPNTEIPTVISQLITSYLVEKSVPEPRIRFTKLVVKILESDGSGIKMATVVSQLILSYLSDESILKSIATSSKQTIGIQGTQAGDSIDESA